MSKNKRVVLGMSAGCRFFSCGNIIKKEQGYEVIGVFMKNWEEKGDNETAWLKKTIKM